MSSTKMDQRPVPDEPHVLIFPLPIQGHVNSMLKLAELLLLSRFHVTFLNSEFNHRRLLLHTDIQQRFSHYPKLRFETIWDGLPADHPRSGERVMEIFDAIKLETKPLFRELLISSSRSVGTMPPVTCLIADGIFGFAIDVAKEIGLMCISFRTISPCCFLAYFSLPELIESGEVPFKDEDLDELVTKVPGVENFLRRRDLPSFCRVKDISDQTLQLIITETRNSIRADAHIFNTFEELEGPILTHIRSHCPNLYTIGPLHAHLKSKLGLDTSSSPPSSNSLWEVDRSCIAWLDSQPLKSVIYVSFGSITVLTREQLIEFWHGLMNSGKKFLWVMRPDSIAGKNGEGQIPAELIEGTKLRGYMVGWAPQEEVLAHPAVGGFLTHSGWNSTLESIVAGVPMICWPFFADQQLNSRFVSEVWKLGLDMKDVCNRVVVEKMVNDLMEMRRDDFDGSANRMAEMAMTCLSQGGSSYCHLDRLINDVRSMSIRGTNS